MTAPFTPRDGDFIRELLTRCPEPVAEAPRYDLRASSDGYEITEYGVVIARFQGPQFSLAAKLLRMLKHAEDASRNQPCADAQERSPLAHNLLHKDES